MKLADRIHERWVFPRRVRILAGHLDSLLPAGVSVLDVGCGDGSLAREVHRRRPDLALSALDVLRRPVPCYPVAIYAGNTLPQAAGSFVVDLLVDVLHHAVDPPGLLRECARVARQLVVIKDHLREGFLAEPTLRAMDWVGNARYGIRASGGYWTRAEWQATLRALGLSLQHWEEHLGLYPFPWSLLFDRSLHFLACLAPPRSAISGAASKTTTPREGIPPAGVPDREWKVP